VDHRKPNSNPFGAGAKFGDSAIRFKLRWVPELFELSPACQLRRCMSRSDIGDPMLGIADYGAFCAAIIIFLALPGPGTFALLASTGQGGFKAGAAATLGVIAGDQVLMWCALAGVATLLAAHPGWFRAVQYAGAAYLGWIGLKLIFVKAGVTSPMHIEPRHYARQAFYITLLNPKAIVFYMAFFPLFIDPEAHRGLVTFGAMAITIALLLTALYCLSLCACVHAIGTKMKAHRRLARGLERLAGGFQIGFGIKLGTQ
jgi:leucine efflux protein